MISGDKYSVMFYHLTQRIELFTIPLLLDEDEESKKKTSNKSIRKMK